ncbi:MAG: IS4 family transposase [Proteobacteria bacterium]|nr:IS4 family transposase [Pseudomonadota bacterium]
MPSKPISLSGSIRTADYLSMGLLASTIPIAAINQALLDHDCQGQRQRDFPPHAVAWYVIALSLYRHANTEEVLRVVTEGMTFLGEPAQRRHVGKSGISAARTRLGHEVMQSIAAQCLQPFARDAEQTPAAFYRQWHIVSIDGSTLEVPDEQACREYFGAPGTQQGRTGYPQMRFVGLLEHGTHALFGVTLGGYKDAEITLARQSITHLRPRMLCLADRGFAGFTSWLAAKNTGAQLLWRIPKNRELPVHKRLPDGSYLSQIQPAAATIKNSVEAFDVTPIVVRVIEYQLPDMPDAEPLYRLITTLLDANTAPAKELAELYQSRWSIETSFAEIKTTLKGSDIVMRSKTPDLLKQEFWGLLLAHHVVRKMMQEAGLMHQKRADDLSFKQSLNIVRRKLPVSGAISP